MDTAGRFGAGGALEREKDPAMVSWLDRRVCRRSFADGRQQGFLRTGAGRISEAQGLGRASRHQFLRSQGMRLFDWPFGENYPAANGGFFALCICGIIGILFAAISTTFS